MQDILRIVFLPYGIYGTIRITSSATSVIDYLKHLHLFWETFGQRKAPRSGHSRPVWWCGYRSLWYHNYDISPSRNSTLNINYNALKHHTGDWYSHSSMRIAKVSGAAYSIEIGVTIATQWRHFCFYSWWILLKSRSFLSKLSTVLVVSEFLKQVLWERFRSIFE